MTTTDLPRKARYTTTDVAEMIIEVHRCLDDTRQELADHRTDVARNFGALGERVAKVEGRSEAVATRIGAGESAQDTKKAFLASPMQMVFGIGAIVILYRIIAAVAPALHQALLHVAI